MTKHKQAIHLFALMFGILSVISFASNIVSPVYAQTIEERLDALEASDVEINSSVSAIYDYMVELFTILFSALPVIQADVEGLKNGTITVPVGWSTISSIPADIADGDDIGTIGVTNTHLVGVTIFSNQDKVLNCPSGSYVSGITFGYSNDLHGGTGVSGVSMELNCKTLEIQSP